MLPLCLMLTTAGDFLRTQPYVVLGRWALRNLSPVDNIEVALIQLQYALADYYCRSETDLAMDPGAIEVPLREPHRWVEQSASGVFGEVVLDSFYSARYRSAMSDADHLTPADPKDVALALAIALSTSGRRRIPGARKIMADIVAKRLVERLEQSGFVVMQKPPSVGGAALGRGADGR
jgi:hypothetical protein